MLHDEQQQMLQFRLNLSTAIRDYLSPHSLRDARLPKKRSIEIITRNNKLINTSINYNRIWIICQWTTGGAWSCFQTINSYSYSYKTVKIRQFFQKLIVVWMLSKRACDELIVIEKVNMTMVLFKQ